MVLEFGCARLLFNHFGSLHIFRYYHGDPKCFATQVKTRRQNQVPKTEDTTTTSGRCNESVVVSQWNCSAPPWGKHFIAIKWRLGETDPWDESQWDTVTSDDSPQQPQQDAPLGGSPETDLGTSTFVIKKLWGFLASKADRRLGFALCLGSSWAFQRFSTGSPSDSQFYTIFHPSLHSEGWYFVASTCILTLLIG